MQGREVQGMVNVEKVRTKIPCFTLYARRATRPKVTPPAFFLQTVSSIDAAIFLKPRQYPDIYEMDDSTGEIKLVEEEEVRRV